MSTDLNALIVSFRDATQYWVLSLGSDKISQVQASEVANPLGELLNLTKLIRAHTTKVGIIFKPETLKKEPTTAYNTLEKLSQTLILTISVIAQLKPSDISVIFYEELLSQTRQLIESSHELAKELLLIYEDDNDEGRLVSVGKVWANCDSMTKVINDGALGLLTEKIKQSIVLVDDGFDEFAEWTENPESVDDPFGFSDDEEEDGEEQLGEKEEQSEEEEDNTELIAYAKDSLNKIKLVKLLLASCKKSLPKSTTPAQINEIYRLQKSIVIHIDEFIVDLMLERAVTSKVDSLMTQISTESKSLAKIVQAIHVQDAKKSAWYKTWITKYDT
ncbi:uncharacterized protein LODBEIA_P19240 [Lodderomyces beijingensis]|uniref:Cyclin-D1-binding protein 1-like N-terminal domain-containing protein n=1 Tax=Lodderomyces beijingensis TaxID=1775926 RepID=A0ABP0ZKH8_9ASCO